MANAAPAAPQRSRPGSVETAVGAPTTASRVKLFWSVWPPLLACAVAEVSQRTESLASRWPVSGV